MPSRPTTTPPRNSARLTGLTFLTPTAGVIAGAVAAPVVVFYYMLKLRRKPAQSSKRWNKHGSRPTCRTR